MAVMLKLCDGSRMNRNTQFRKYLYRLRYDSVIQSDSAMEILYEVVCFAIA